MFNLIMCHNADVAQFRAFSEKGGFMAIEKPTRYIKLTDCHNTAIVTHCPFAPPEHVRYERINDSFYYVPNLHEIRAFKPKSETKGDNLHSVRKSFNRLKSIINANYESPKTVKYVTLTYARNMQCNDRIRHDMQKFLRKMHRRYGKFEYIYVKEQQARGAWHMHMILFFPPPEAPYMSNNDESHDVRDMWGHGFVNVQGFGDNINNLGNYLCAYLTDDEETSKKGARLANYESGIRLYNCSRGISRPSESSMTYAEYLEFATSDDNFLLSEREKEVNVVDESGSPARFKTQMFVTL